MSHIINDQIRDEILYKIEEDDSLDLLGDEIWDISWEHDLHPEDDRDKIMELIFQKRFEEMCE